MSPPQNHLSHVSEEEIHTTQKVKAERSFDEIGEQEVVDRDVLKSEVQERIHRL